MTRIDTLGGLIRWTSSMRAPRITRRGPTLGLLVGLCACGGHAEFDPPDREARLLDAEARFEEVRFDEVAWESDEVRARTGNEVYARECRNCHGTLGHGDTEYARARRLSVPSLVESDWSMAGSLDSVRHRVFVGHLSGMPTWGVAGITAAEIDAVAFYVLERLRPDALGGGA